MTLSRRSSIRVFGMALASLLMARCKNLKLPSATPTPLPTCYTVIPSTEVSATPTSTCYTATPYPDPAAGSGSIPASLPAMDRLRVCWLSFDVLAQKTISNQGDDSQSEAFAQYLSAEHRKALDEIVAAGEIEAVVATLVQEAYDAALYHVWRSNASMTCYEPMIVDFAPTSAGQLVQQSAILAQMAEEGQVNPDTVAVAQQAIKHDLAFEALTNEEVQTLYQTLIDESEQNDNPIPSFEEAPLEITPEIEQAAQFLTNLMSEK